MPRDREPVSTLGDRRGVGAPRTLAAAYVVGQARLLIGLLAVAAVAVGVLADAAGASANLTPRTSLTPRPYTGPGIPNPPAWAKGKRVHFFPAPALERRLRSNGGRQRPNGALCPTDCGSGTPPLVYSAYQGPVQQNPQIYLIWWGSTWNQPGYAGDRSQVRSFFNSLSGSAYQGILSQYYGPAQNYIPSTATVAGDWTDTSVAAPSGITDAAVQAEIGRAISTQGWAQSINAQFVVLSAPGTTYASGFADSFCAYHEVYVKYTPYATTGTYAYEPYPGDPPFSTTNDCGSVDASHNYFHVQTFAASHEYAESATDPDLSAWTSSDGPSEISDMCQDDQDQLLPNNIYVTALWDNHENNCSTTDTATYPPDVTTGSATGISPAGATVSGTVTPRGAATAYHVDYGTSTSYGSSTSGQSAGSGYAAVPESTNLTGLHGGALYHYRIVASNAAGTAYGADQTIFIPRPTFNGDGLADFVVCAPGTQYAVAVSTGSSLGGAGTGIWSNWACDPDARVGDFNGDGRADIIVPNPNDNTWNVSISTGSDFGGAGTGTWLSGWTARPTWVGVGDFNGDGKADLAMCVNNTYDVALSTGSSLGGSGTGAWLTGWACSPNARVGDFNGDGKDDIIVPDTSNNTWAVALSTGSSFGASGTGTWLTGWTAQPTWVGVGDFNGDGKSDLVVCNSNQYSVALSNGSQLAGSGVWSNWACDPNAGVGDFNGDGKADLTVPDTSSNTWAVDLSSGSSFGASGTGTWLTGWTAQPTWAGVGS